MKVYSVAVYQSKVNDLPKNFLVRLSRKTFSDPPMNVYSIDSCDPSIGRRDLVLSPRILNNPVDNARGIGGYLLQRTPEADPDSLSSYTSLAKVWVTPVDK